VTIGDLLPFTFYEFTVVAFTIETGEAAPTAPTNVIATEVNSTHVTVEWDEPDTPNGIVRQYIISYNLSESDDITLTGSARTVTIGDLLPFTFYEFTVVAFTIETGQWHCQTLHHQLQPVWIR
jgi:cytidine deaminase